ncbi:LA_0364 family Cys-rich lipoprotein [Leptospira santarosai]|uniref:LA_0364 family Cys-rich lipoprotein n=1 Tax=Leptospira santarosai TaxID=28183 RepID=UPI0038B3EE6C
MKKVMFLCLLFLIGCNEYFLTRQKCYSENSCDTAVEDCLIGINLGIAFLKSNSTSHQNQISMISDLFSPILCINAKHNCESNCNATHPF